MKCKTNQHPLQVGWQLPYNVGEIGNSLKVLVTQPARFGIYAGSLFRFVK